MPICGKENSGFVKKSRISYPTTAAEKRNAEQKSQHSIEMLLADMTPTARAFNPTSVLIRDTLPYLMTIMQPNLRPVNTHLYTQREKDELHNLVNLHIAFNLKYVQEKNLEGVYLYRLEPNVEDVVFFPEMNHQILPYAIKQMIAHEVEIELMRRKEGPTSLESIPQSNQNQQPGQPNEPKKKVAGEDQMRSIEELTKKLQAKDISLKERVPVDFFGRPIVKSTSQQAAVIQSEKDSILSSDVWFKFKEGYNNAVRRNIRVQDLF